MPAYQVTGPDGKKYKVDAPEGASSNDAIAYVYNTYYVGKPEEPERPGFIKSIGLGAESMLSSGRTALESVLDPEEAARAGLERRQELAKKYGEGLTLDQLKQIYEQEGLLAAAKEVVSEIPSAIGEQIPNIGAMAGGARLGAMAGAPLGPYGAGAGALLGAVAPSFLQQLGGNIERQAVEDQARGEPVDISTGSAAAAAAPQAAVDVVSTYIPLGRTIVGKLFGKEVQALLGAGEKEAAEALAKESLVTTLTKGTAVGALAEIPTEITQQALERAQAGLSLTDDDALTEYGETAFQVSLLAPIGAAGRVVERSAARRGIEPPPERREEEAPPAPPAEPAAVAPAVTEEEPASQINRREETEQRARELRFLATQDERLKQAIENQEREEASKDDLEYLAQYDAALRARDEARRRPLGEEDQMGLPLAGGSAQLDLLAPTEPGQPISGVYRPAEEALADLKPRSRAYKEEAKDLGLRLDRKGNLKPNQFVPDITAQVSPDQERFEFEFQQQLPLTQAAPFEGQGDLFAQEPIPSGPSVPFTRQEPTVEAPTVEVPKEQYALNLPGIPMESLAPRDRVLRAMSITEDKKNIPNLQFATQLRPMELQKTIGDLKKEGAIAFNKQANEWELTPAGAESVRSGPEVKPARPRRRAGVSVQQPRTKAPPTAGVGERGMAGAGETTTRADVGEGAGEPALTEKPQITLREQVMMLGRQVDEERRATQQRVAQQAIGQVNSRRSSLQSQAVDAFENDQISEKTYTEITDQLKRPVPNFGMVEKVLSGEVKPGRRGIKFQRVPSTPKATAEVTFRFRNKSGEIETKTVSQDISDEYAGVLSAAEDRSQIAAAEEEFTDRLFYNKVDGKFDDVEILSGGVTILPVAKVATQRGEVGAGLPAERVQAAANDAVRTWTNAPKVVVASSVNDPAIPEPLRKQIPKDAPGFYVDGTTYVIADRAKDEASVRGTVFHESLGHYGLEQEFQGGLQDVMQGIYNTNPKMRDAANERMKKFDLDAATAVEEVLAERSEAGPVKESWLRDAFNRVAAYIRNFLRQRGLVSTYSDNDVSQILKQAHRRVIEGKKAPYDPFDPAIRYQRSPEAQRKGDSAFVNAIGKIPQNLPVATKETYTAAKNAASNLPSATRRAFYSLYDPHELGRIYSKDIKSNALENLWKNANQEGAELRKMQDAIMDNMTNWNKVMEKYSPAEQNRIRNLFMDTTTTKTEIEVIDAKGKAKKKEVFGVEVLNFVDPARNVNWKADDHPLAKQFERLDAPVKELYKQLRLSYVDNALAVENELKKYLTPGQWQKILNKLNEQRVRVYLPLFREGPFKLSYTDKAGNPVALQFETSAERSAAIKEILREGVDPNSIDTSRVEDRKVQDIPPSSFLADIVADMKEAKVADDIVMGVIEHYLDYLPTNSVLQRGRRRQEVTPAGYSNDVLKAYANVADSYARRITKMQFAPKYREQQEELKAALDTAVRAGAIKPDEAEDLNNYVDKYVDFTQNPNLSNWGAKLGYASFQLYLGANISTAVTNVIDTPTVMLSRLLGKGHSIGNVGNALLNAGSIFFSKRKSPEMQELLKRGLDTGILREQRLQDIAEFKNLGSRWEKLKANVDRITAYAFAKSDIFNRQVGLIAAYNLEKAKNKTAPDVFDPKAFEVAESVVADVYGSSFPKAAAPIMGSDIAKTALTFKRFGIKRINLLQAAYKEATRDLDPNDPDSKIIRDAARREILGYFGTAFVSAGAQGMPLVGGAMLLASVLNGIFGDDDEPYNPDFHLRETVGLFAYKGPINYLLGVDIASRTGWTGMFWREDPKRVAEVGPVTYAMEQLLGPAYSYAVGMPKAYDYMKDGNYQRAFEQMAPRSVANISKGFRYGTEGALTAKGVPLVDDVNAYNVFMQIIGFRPSDVAEAGDIAGATKQMESKIFQRRNAIIARAAVARMSGDVDGFREAVAEAAEFSRKYPGLGITPETVFEAVQRRTKKLAMSVNGVTVNPKIARGIYEELGVTEEIE